MVAFEDVRRIALALPETDEHPSYGDSVSFRVRKKAFAYFHPDDERLVVRVDPAELAALLASQPETYYVTPHYAGSPYVLVRLATVDPAELAELLEDAWRDRAPKRLVAAYDATGSPGSESP